MNERGRLPLNLSVPRELHERLKAEAGPGGNMREVARRILGDYFNGAQAKQAGEEVIARHDQEVNARWRAKYEALLDVVDRLVSKR